MEFPPQKFREIVFQLLFSLDGSGSAEVELIPCLMRELAVSKKHVSAASNKATLIWQKHAFLDQIISEQSREYAFDRIKTVEKNVLRLAVYELLIDKELSPKIIISEAYRLTRKFGTVEGASFVNALLDNVGKYDNGTALSLPEGETAQ